MRADRVAAPVLGALGAFAACQPRGEPVAEVPCEALRPAPRELVVGLVGCPSLIPGGGEGRDQTDLYLATNAWRVVIRHPLDALTVVGGAGGTVVDAAPWGAADGVHEAIPIVGGGWLGGESTFEVTEDGFAFTGTVAPLPGLPPPEALGEVRTVVYRAVPDEPSLRAEGADGWWVHPRGDVDLYGGIAVAPGRAVGAIGEVDDFGGAFAVWGSEALVIDDDVGVWAARGITRPVSGTAPLAAAIALYRDGIRVGRVPVTPPSFAFDVDLTVDELRAEAPGYAPSARVPAGADVTLALGGRGTVTLVPKWPDLLPHWFRARWTAEDGRSGSAVVDPAGGTLLLGAGVYDLTLGAGPAFAEDTLHVEIPPDRDVELPFRLATRIPAGSYALASFGRPADRSRDWRGSDVTAAREAAADGVVYATFTPEADVPSVLAGAVGAPRLVFRNGVRMDGDGYTVGSWPWGASSRRALHGGPRVGAASPLDDAAVLIGGPDDARTLWVDLPWLERAGTPFTVEEAPDLVALGPPGASAAAWAPWLAWLDARRPVVPTGPLTWVRVTDPALVGLQDFEQSLARGAVTAGNGPLVTLSVDGVGPGFQVPAPPADTAADTAARSTGDTGATAAGPIVRRVVVDVTPLEGIQHVVLLGAGGAQTVLPVRDLALDLPLDGAWVAVAAWSDDPDGPWAVTGPVWLLSP